MEIKPTYISFEQAKWLKEKGFDEPTWCHYYKGKFNYGILDNGEIQFNSDSDYVNDECFAAPEQWLALEWLRVNHGIWIAVTPVLVEKAASPIKFDYEIYYSDEIKYGDEVEIDYLPANTPQEAYSAAFDYIKDNNLI